MEDVQISERQLLCLSALHLLCKEQDEGTCFYTRTIAKEAGMDEKKARIAIRALVRKGLAEYRRGLMNDDAMCVGSGYCISTEGKKLMPKEEPE